jgi:hypothetical protein
LRDYLGRSLGNCEHIQVDEQKNVGLNTNAEEIVFSFQVPLPRDNKVLRLHRLFQSMTAELHLQVRLPPPTEAKFMIAMPHSKLTHKIPIEINLFYRNTPDYDDDWHEIASSKINKEFTCATSEYSLECDMVRLFELASVYNEFYLINLKLGDSIKLTNHLRNDHNNGGGMYKHDDVPDVYLFIKLVALHSCGCL